MTLLTINEPSVAVSRKTGWKDFPVLQLGFRPFYLLAAGFAALAVPLWLARYFGMLPGMNHVGLYWHIHEMVFGFIVAVIIGFLYTAGRNWTGLWTPRKGRLAAIAALWVAGRVAMIAAGPLTAAAVDLLFLPCAAWPLYRVLRQSGNKRNLFLIGLLAMLALLNAAFHAATLGWIAWSPLSAIQAAILVIVIIESVIGARVIPMFTANGAPGVRPVVNAKRDAITIFLTAFTVIAWIAGLPAPAFAALATAAACSQLLRIAGWKPHRTLGRPLLWILHLSYAWIPVGFLLMALAALGIATSSAAFHALTVGSMAGLIIGMITRTALGHTGRMLKSGRPELAMYLLVQAGAVLRLAAAIDAGDLRNAALLLSGACWAMAFLLYLAVYGPYLCRPRIDGKEG